MANHLPAPSRKRFSAAWYPQTLLSRLSLPPVLQPWLITQHSLTQQLRQICPELTVHILAEHDQKPLPQEAVRLQLSHNQYTWNRTVLLQCGATPLVYARTVIPACQAGNPWFALKQLGNQPLGEVLFQNPQPHRDPFLFSKSTEMDWPYLISHFRPHNQPLSNQPTYNRQSCFWHQQSPLLLSEVFLAPLLQRLDDKDDKDGKPRHRG